MAESPTSRTLALLRKEGWRADVVEYWSHRPAQEGKFLWTRNKRHDLFGFTDILAVRVGELLFVQCTTTSNQASRVTKITRDCAEAAALVLSTGARIEVWGWRKYPEKVERRLWRETRKPITQEMIWT